MMHHFPNDDKENADPRFGHSSKPSSNARPLSPGKRKRTPEEKQARPPLADITALPGITPTFVLEPPAFAIAADAEAATATVTTTAQQQEQPGASAGSSSSSGKGKKKKAAAPGSGDSSSKPGGSKKPGAGGAGPNTLAGMPLRPLR